MAEANLVKGDLLEILASWPESATEDKFKSKIALACMELLVPLTWPIEKNDMQMTVNHHRHVPFLQLAQISYKQAILEHESGTILRTCVRVGLPSIALPLNERSQRDEGIIKLLLYFCRNVAMISESKGFSSNDREGRISRSVTIEAFRDQEVLALLLTLASNMGEDFNAQDSIVIDVLFHLLKGFNVETLFMDQKQLAQKSGNELKSLLVKEANMHRSYAKNAPTRHNRFGTMIWIKRDDAGRHSTVSGQDVLKNGQQALSKMDQTKKWNRPRRLNKDEDTNYDRFDLDEPLSELARNHLRSFVEEFLDSGFNPLFNHLRRAIERNADRVLESHKQQFFYLISWFLEAERVRRKRRREAEKVKRNQKIGDDFEEDSFALIASVLTQESFVLLNRYMQDRFDMKAWRELQAGIRCFTQILLIVQEMAESPSEEDQEIAENIQNRIFYEETTHDRIVAILRGYKDQGFGYLDACTELAHVFLRMLEKYSREHVDLQVRSRRRAKKKVVAQQKPATGQDEEDEESDLEEIREAERTSRERQFDFKRFSAKFTTQPCVDTFVLFLKYYNDLTIEQLKRAHRYFYRVVFKQDLGVMLFRLDIVALFNRLVKGPENLDSKNPMYAEWNELVRQVLKKLFKKLDQRPELIIELLFSKINSTTFFLEHGYEKQTTSKPKAPATLEVQGEFTHEQKIGIVVSALRDEDGIGAVSWVMKNLESAFEERRAWEAEALARKENETTVEETVLGKPEIEVVKLPVISVVPSNEPLRIAMFKMAKLRLLMTLCGWERLGVEDEAGAAWIIPSSMLSTELWHLKEIIARYQSQFITEFGEDEPRPPEEWIRRKAPDAAKRAEYDDDSDGSLGIGSGEEFLYPAGGPTNIHDKKEKTLNALKKRHRRRHLDDSEEGGLDDAALEAKRKSREQAELERRRKIKSEEFIHDSDDDTDEERDQQFFAREETRRIGQSNKVMEALAAGRVYKTARGEGGSKRKRKGGQVDIDVGASKRWKASSDISSDDDDMDIEHDLPPAAPRVRSSSSESVDSSSPEQDEEPEDGGKDTPLSSPPHLPRRTEISGAGNMDESLLSSQQETRLKTAELSIEARGEEVDEDEDEAPVIGSRRKARAVLVDSDDDE